MAAPQDTLTLTINGQVYSGWTEIDVTRRIDRMVSDFNIGVTDRWAGQDLPWQINRFDECTISIGSDLVLTGYVDEYAPSFDSTQHSVRIKGRSKTADLVDCTPDIPSGQFKGYRLSQIALGVAAIFGIDVDVQADDPQVFPDATLQRSETAYAFLERLARQSAVMLTDDPQGRLVLARTGQVSGEGALVQAPYGNVLGGRATLSGQKRFSIYIVKGQKALASGDDTAVQTSQRATALDPLVPRYRPHVTIAESQLDARGMQQRANWQRNFAFGRSTTAILTVQGWRQAGGTLWQVNQLVPVIAPFFQIDQQLLCVGVRYKLDDRAGTTTEITLGPPEGYTPDPGQIRFHKGKGGKGGAASWDGAGGIP